MHEWARTVLEFTQLRRMREFCAIAEDFTLTLPRSRKREPAVIEVCATETNAEVVMCRIFQQRNSAMRLLSLTLVQVHSIVMQYMHL